MFVVKKIEKQFLVWLALFSLLLAPPLYAENQTQLSVEYGIKGALLKNFLYFINFPESPDHQIKSSINICIDTDLSLMHLFHTIDHTKAHQREIHVRHFDNLSTIENCNVIFRTRFGSINEAELLAKTEAQQIVTIGETKDFCLHGGIINFYIQKGKTRFEINYLQAKKAGFKIRSDLLKLARIIE